MAISRPNQSLYQQLEAMKIEGVSFLTDGNFQHLRKAFAEELKKAQTETHSDFLFFITDLCEPENPDPKELKDALTQLMDDFVVGTAEKQINIPDTCRSVLVKKYESNTLQLTDFQDAVKEVWSLLTGDVLTRCADALNIAHKRDMDTPKRKVLEQEQNIKSALQSASSEDKRHIKESLKVLTKIEKNIEEKLSPEQAQAQLTEFCIKETEKLQKKRDLASVQALVKTLSRIGSPSHSAAEAAGRSPLNANHEHFRLLNKYERIASNFLENVTAILNKLASFLVKAKSNLEGESVEFIGRKFTDCQDEIGLIMKGALSSEINELKKQVEIFTCKGIGISVEGLRINQAKMSLIAKRMNDVKDKILENEAVYVKLGFSSEHADYIKTTATQAAEIFATASHDLGNILAIAVSEEKKSSPTRTAK